MERKLVHELLELKELSCWVIGLRNEDVAEIVSTAVNDVFQTTKSDQVLSK